MKTLGSLRISEKSYNGMQAALRKLNDDSPFIISQAAYRRLALENLNQIILSGKDIPKVNL